jgi:hypothetical protein
MYKVTSNVTPDGVFFSARTDNRDEATMRKVCNDKVHNKQSTSPFIRSVVKHQCCDIKILADGLAKREAEKLKKAYIDVYRNEGHRVLNKR